MTLCFLCHELGINMDIQKRLHDEIVQVNDELHGKSVTFEALQKMKYLDMVVSEGLRKWPLAVIMDRNTNKQYVLEDYDGTKALLQPNDIVWFPIYGMVWCLGIVIVRLLTILFCVEFKLFIVIQSTIRSRRFLIRNASLMKINKIFGLGHLYRSE